MDLQDLVSRHSGHPDWGEFASRVLENGPNPKQGNKSDEAHPPIHPTKCVHNLSGELIILVYATARSRISKYNIPSIYRASWGKGNMHGISNCTVNRIWVYISLHIICLQYGRTKMEHGKSNTW